MSCCGRRRQAMGQAPVRWARPPARVPIEAGVSEAASNGSRPRIEVRFVGRGAYLVAGPASRDIYRFSAEAPRAFVDARDLAALLKTGLFEVGER